MTSEEKKIYNNGFILGMASKGVIVKKETIKIGDTDSFKITIVDSVGLVQYEEVI